ncbi:hypothetical protein D3C71_720840 [compost metagenome]
MMLPVHLWAVAVVPVKWIIHKVAQVVPVAESYFFNLTEVLPEPELLKQMVQTGRIQTRTIKLPDSTRNAELMVPVVPEEVEQSLFLMEQLFQIH